jgi:hypothetical protein
MRLVADLFFLPVIFDSKDEKREPIEALLTVCMFVEPPAVLRAFPPQQVEKILIVRLLCLLFK